MADNSLLAQMVAVAWVRGWIDNPTVRAIAQCNGAGAGARICGAVNRGHLVEIPGHDPKRWGLSAERLEAIASFKNPAWLRTEAEKTRQRVERICRIQVAERDAQRLQRQDAWSAQAISRGDARRARAKANREAAEAARAASRAQLQAAKQAAREARHAAKVAARQSFVDLPGSRGRNGQMGPMRPPAPVGADLVAKPLPSVAASVTVAAPAVPWADVPVQDPQGLLVRRQAVEPTQPFRLRGGLLAPADGPYIRPGALAALALPSRRAEGLVPHRAPLSQP